MSKIILQLPLTASNITSLSILLDTAELRVRERKDLTLRYWRETVDGLLNFQGKVVLQGAGSVSNRQMEEHVNAIYEQFNARRKAFAAAEADREDQLELSAPSDEDLAALQSLAERREN